MENPFVFMTLSVGKMKSLLASIERKMNNSPDGWVTLTPEEAKFWEIISSDSYGIVEGAFTPQTGSDMP